MLQGKTKAVCKLHSSGKFNVWPVGPRKTVYA
jgi:hypothetical protein